MRVIVFVLVVFLIYLQYILWFSKGGIRDEQMLKRTVAQQQAEISVLKERNQALAAEVLDLKQGMEAIEELALKGGGHGLFVGCAAGDTAAAVVFKVGA